MPTPSVATPERLRASADISAVLSARHSRAGRLLVVHGRSRGDGLPARVAVIASRKVGTAVRRNRAKRLLREAARAVGFREGLDVVLIARRAASRAPLADVVEELQELAGRLQLLEDAGAA